MISTDRYFPSPEKLPDSWVHAVQRRDFKPISSSTLYSLHFKETDFYSAIVSGKQMLKKFVVPTVFNFLNHLLPKIKERKILQRENTTTTTAVHNSDNTATCETGTKFVDIGVQTKLTGEELEITLEDLCRDKKILQQKLSIRDNNNHLIGDTVNDIFKNQFDSSLPFALFQNEIANVNNASNHKSYPKEIREFCLTLHFYFPRAFEFIRQRSTLPDPSTIRRWIGY
ncbi:hypothetical protein QTP88_025577 [Uroleucon formosanum]